MAQPSSFGFGRRLEDRAGALQISCLDVNVPRTGRAPFGAADHALERRLNARLRETLLNELSFSFIRSGGDDAPRTGGPWIRLSHDPEGTAGSRRARSLGAVFGRLRDTRSRTQTSSQLYAGYWASMIARP